VDRTKGRKDDYISLVDLIGA